MDTSTHEKHLYAFRAGRAFRRGTTNFVDPAPEKGILSVRNEADGLLHLYWANRETQQVDLDLILFPEEASLIRVAQATEGRVCVLKFTSSDQRHFFWLQDSVTSHDEQDITNLNGLLADPSYTPDVADTLSIFPPVASTPLLIPSSMTDAVPAQQTQPVASTSAGTRSGAGHPLTAAQIAELSNLMAVAVRGAPSTSAAPELLLTDVLTPQNVAPLFTAENRPILQAIFPHLPPDLPTEPSPEILRRVVQSPQFQSQVRNLDRALSTGLLGGLVTGLGLPEEAGTSVGAFLRAVADQAGRQGGGSGGSGGDTMETD